MLMPHFSFWYTSIACQLHYLQRKFSGLVTGLSILHFLHIFIVLALVSYCSESHNIMPASSSMLARMCWLAGWGHRSLPAHSSPPSIGEGVEACQLLSPFFPAHPPPPLHRRWLCEYSRIHNWAPNYHPYFCFGQLRGAKLERAGQRGMEVGRWGQLILWHASLFRGPHTHGSLLFAALWKFGCVPSSLAPPMEGVKPWSSCTPQHDPIHSHFDLVPFQTITMLSNTLQQRENNQIHWQLSVLA